jgi:cardiolipin synthase A/B
VDLEIYTKTSEIWEAMYADCVQAKKSIEIEQYILEDDKTGGRFIRLFTEKVRQGVAVRLMLDRIGSLSLALSSSFSEFTKAGGVAYFYNPINLGNAFVPPRWFPRDHVKTLLIDSSVCYSGSACIREDMADWHDLQMRFTGSPVEEVRRHFLKLWGEAGKNETNPSRNGQAGRKTFYVVSEFGVQRNPIYREVLQSIRNAKRSIRIVTPYFLPPWLLRGALCKALKRNVTVQVMVSEKSDIRIADYVSRSYYPRLLRNGTQILHYQKTVLHAKYILIDEDWATVGSANMDYLSLLRNREANIFTTDQETIMKIRDDFEECIKHCHAIDMAYYHRIPLLQKILGYLGRGIRRVL